MFTGESNRSVKCHFTVSSNSASCHWTCVGACASSNSLYKNQCNTNKSLSPPPLVRPRQSLTVLWHTYECSKVGPIIACVSAIFGGRGAGGGGERRNVKDAWGEKKGCFLVLRKLLLVSFCVVVWVLFSVFSIFCITSLVSATPRNHQKRRGGFLSPSRVPLARPVFR